MTIMGDVVTARGVCPLVTTGVIMAEAGVVVVVVVADVVVEDDELLLEQFSLPDDALLPCSNPPTLRGTPFFLE